MGDARSTAGGKSIARSVGRRDRRRTAWRRTARHALALAVLGAVVGGAVLVSIGLGGSGARNGADRPGGPATAAAAQPGALRFGVAYGDRLVGLAPAELAATLNSAVRLGAGWIRVDLGWDGVAPDGPGRYRWAAFDRVVAAARARHLQVLPILAYTPPWARPAGCDTPKCAPDRPDAFARFAGDAARRYAPRGVHTWEIWNEPNMTGFWRPAPDPARYLDLLRPTAAAVRAADPDAYLVSGGLAALPSTDGNINELDYLGRLCARGLGGLVDAVGFHPYTYPHLPSFRAPWAVGTAWNRIDATSPSIASVLGGCGPNRLKVWLTEYGAPTGGPGRVAADPTRPAPSAVDHVDERLQAAIGADAVRTAAADPFIQALFWYTDRDDRATTATTPVTPHPTTSSTSTDPDPTTPDPNTSNPSAPDPTTTAPTTTAPAAPASTEDFYGLRRVDGSEKPAYGAIRSALSALGPSTGR